MAHVKVVPLSSELNENVADVDVVLAGGAPVIDATGGRVSCTQL